MTGEATSLVALVVFCGLNLVKASESKVSMVFAGDISFNGIIEYMVDKDHCTYEESLEKLKPVFKDVDFVVANLESVVYKEAENDVSKIYGPKITLPANGSSVHSIQDLSALKALKDAGINTVSVANSHVGHYTVAQEQLKSHKIKYFGLSKDNNRVKQKPLILKKRGVKVGLLGYCMTKGCKKTKDNSIGAALLQIKTAVKQAKKLRKSGVHAVIMFLNWGSKYQSVISPNAILTIRKIISKVKIDLIVGTHPGVTHAHWIVNQTLIASSLGNLLAPPYMSADMNFAPKYKNATNKALLPMYEKLWHKQMKIMDDPSRYGKLLKVEIDHGGVMLEKSRCLRTHITTTEDKKQCLAVRSDVQDDWQQVCAPTDFECAGTYECNYIECNAKDPLPEKLTKEDKKKGKNKKKKKKKKK